MRNQRATLEEEDFALDCGVGELGAQGGLPLRAVQSLHIKADHLFIGVVNATAMEE